MACSSTMPQPGLQEMPATLAELWNKALLRRASASSSAPPPAPHEGPVASMDSAALHAEVAALLTEEGEGAVLSELLGEASSDAFAMDPDAMSTHGVDLRPRPQSVVKKKRRRGSPREQHRATSDTSTTSSSSDASTTEGTDTSSSSVMTMLYPSLF